MTKIFMRGFVIILFLSLLVTCKKDKSTTLKVPENVEASDDFSLKIVLDWDDVEDADGYNIYRADYDGDTEPDDSDYDKVGESEDSEYEDISVVSNSSYYYKIEAYSGKDKSKMSDPVEGVTIEISVEEAFDALADLTDGKRYDAADASEVPDIIIDVINDEAITGTDLVFLIDNTSSMYDDIDQVKAAVTNIISQLPSNTRLAVAVYNDKNEDPTGWYSYVDFSKDYTAATSFINNIDVYGGGDTPESVYDGIVNVINDLNWSSTSKRMMIVIGDAPPLEGDLTDYTLEEVIAKCTAASLTTNLYPILIAE
jgi:hypothetical protein